MVEENLPAALKAALADNGYVPTDFVYKLAVSGFFAGWRQGIIDATCHPFSTTGSQLIAVERERQITSENWSPEHDDKHDGGELVAAAVTYALETTYDGPAVTGTWFKKFWCFDDSWFKPKDKIRDLVRAGALLAAEIDRLQRKENKNV